MLTIVLKDGDKKRFSPSCPVYYKGGEESLILIYDYETTFAIRLKAIDFIYTEGYFEDRLIDVLSYASPLT